MKKDVPSRILAESTYLANAIGRGLLAGLAGTVAITLSQKIEMAITGRQPGIAPAEAVEKTLELMPENRDDEKRLSRITHWGYGTTWGLFRAALDEAGLRGWEATAVHFTAIYGVALFALPEMNIYSPVTKWTGRQIAIDAIHHAVYAAAAGAVYDTLRGGEKEMDQDTLIPNE